jgi:hypothetical protein
MKQTVKEICTPKNVTLVEVLATQDYHISHAEKLGDLVLNNKFDISKDPISGIIINAFVDNDYSDYEGMEQDLQYAINSLQKAKNRISSRQQY